MYVNCLEYSRTSHKIFAIHQDSNMHRNRATEPSFEKTRFYQLGHEEFFANKLRLISTFNRNPSRQGSWKFLIWPVAYRKIYTGISKEAIIDIYIFL